MGKPRGQGMTDKEVIELLGEISRLRTEVKFLNYTNNRLIQSLIDVKEENKTLRKQLKER